MMILGVLLVLIFINPGGVFTEQKRPPSGLSEKQIAEIDAEGAARFKKSLEGEMIVKAKRAITSSVKDPDSV